MRILIITPSLPYPPNWGFGIRVYQIARLLARTHDVALLTYTAPGQEEHVAALRAQGVDVHAVPSSNPHNRKQERRREQMLSLASPVSYLTRSLYSRAMQQEIDRLLAEKQFDIVQMESTHLASFDLSKAGCVVVDEHNIEYELLYRMYKSERSPWRRLFNWAEYVKFRREERRCWDHACALVLTSDREREIIAATWPGKAPVTVAPNGVDVEYFAPSAEPIDPNSLVYTGLMRYRPNIDAVVYFATEILPLIRQRRPDATFTIVGAGPSIDVRELASDHVIVTGSVPDVRPYVARAAVNVVPLRMGSGTRLKVLEGLSMEKPMVSTAVGCEGIDVHNGEHLLIADEPAAFADAVLGLMDDRELAQRLGQAGRALTLERYAWESIVGGLDRFLAQVAGKPAAAVGGS